jgi:Uma2 family endonuclease
MDVHTYFCGPESNKPQELNFGVLHDPPTPVPHHQRIVVRLLVALDEHVRREGIGEVLVSPLDVVFDAERALILQPDIMFIATANHAIVRDRVWGVPDMVVEVVSPSTARRDRTAKLQWYREYGVKECWIVDPVSETLELVDCASDEGAVRCNLNEPVPSRVLGPVVVPAYLFEGRT